MEPAQGSGKQNMKQNSIRLRIFVTGSRLISSLLIFAKLGLLGSACQKQAPKPQKPEIQLVVSDRFREIFPTLQPNYDLKATHGFFTDMVQRSEHVCRVLHNKLPGRQEIFKAFSPELWTGKFNPYLSEIIAGCYNFFTMNDLAAKNAFEKVNRYFPGKKDCYSVGFVQIYMMHSVMNCSKLVPIDIDWRILHLQFQVISQLYESKPLNFKDLDVRWSANFHEDDKIRPRESNLSVDSFCYRQSWVACRATFQKVAQIFTDIRQIELQLSFLHDIQLRPLSEISVVHVSNAIDPGYTKKEQFDTMLKNMTNVPDKKHKTVVVYHGGGSFQFAIYEVSTSEKGGITVSTKCRDNLEWSKYYKDRPGVKYKTFFDTISADANPERCSV